MGFLKTLGDGYKIMGQETKQKVIDNRANIFTGTSVLGTIATAIISAFAGARSARQIDAEALKVGRELTVKEKAKLCWKNFIAPAGTTVISGAGAITSRVIDSGDIARLTADVTMVTKAYNEFKKASNEVLTEKQQQAVKDKVAENTREQNIKPGEFDKLPNPGGFELPQLFVDGFDPNIKFISTIDKVQNAILECRMEMAQLKPRNKFGYHQTYSSTVNGIPWSSFLIKVGYETPISVGRKRYSMYEKYGWNKGYLEEDGTCTDDQISAYFAPGETEYMGQMRSCYTIVWDQDPSDMSLGDLMKSGTL